MTASTAKVARFWDGHAKGYAKQPIANMESYEATLARTRTYLRPTDRVLEVGCGTGSTAVLLAPEVASIEGTDISPAMIEIAQGRACDEGLQNADFRVATVAQARNAEQGYDAVLAHNIIHLLPSLKEGLQDMASAIAPGGLLISKTPCLGRDGFSLATLGMKAMISVMKLIGKAPHVLFFSSSELEAAIAAAGFEIIESDDFPAGKHHRYIVGQRRS